MYWRNANQNYNKVITSHQSEWPSPKSLQIIKNTEGVQKRESCFTIGRNVNACSHYGKKQRLLKSLKTDLPHGPAIPLMGIYQEKMKSLNSKRYIHPNIHSTLFTTPKAWKQPKCPLTEEWIKTMWCVCVYIYICVCVCIHNIWRSPGVGNSNPLQYSRLENSINGQEEPGGLQSIELQRVRHN